MPKKPETDTLEFEVTATAATGIIVPVKMVVTFPKDYGFYAVKVLEKIHEETLMFYQELINRSDMSVLNALAAQNSGDDEE